MLCKKVLVMVAIVQLARGHPLTVESEPAAIGYFPMDAPMFGCRSVDKMTGQKDTLSREQFCDGVPQCPDGQDEDIISCFLLQIMETSLQRAVAEMEANEKITE